MSHLPEDVLYQILNVSRQLGATADTRSVQVGVVNCLRDVLQAERATVFEYDEATDELVAVLAHGPTGDLDESFSGVRIPAGVGLAGTVARNGEMINIPDAYEDERFNREIDQKTGYRTRSLLTVPMNTTDGRLIGVAQVLNKRNGIFEPQDEAIAEALAAQCAVAMRRSRLIEDRVELEKVLCALFEEDEKSFEAMASPRYESIVALVVTDKEEKDLRAECLRLYQEFWPQRLRHP